MWWPLSGITPRFVLWLVGQLPPESAFGASVRGGPEFRAWTPSLYLQAAIANLLNAANRQRAGKRGNRPLVKPPTTDRRRTTRVLTVAEIARRQQDSAKKALGESAGPDT